MCYDIDNFFDVFDNFSKEIDMEKMEKMNDQELGAIAGGTGAPVDPGWKWVKASVNTGYLALRSFPTYDPGNEVVKIVNGTAFQIKPDKTNGDYVYAYFNGNYGWVNSKYVVGFQTNNTAL